jgi:hypothetical protein
MKKMLIAAAKWAWFGVLVLVGFGYMASGLSDRDEPRPALPASPEVTDAIVSAVNQARTHRLEELSIPSAEPADWLTVCRRLSLALVGSGVSLEEIHSLESLPESQRTSAYLSRLLVDPRFHDYWAERWTRYLVGAEEGPFVVFRRRRFRHWLSEMIAANRPYDQIVHDLITAEGLWTDQPEVNFLTVTFDSNDGQPDPVRLAARTSRAFLGLRIDCLQCHNDFLGNVSLGDPENTREGMQSDFHGLAAFFSSARTNGLQGIRTQAVDYQYQYLDAVQETDIEPAVPFQPECLPDEGDPRTRLATWITHPKNRQFARAAVSRFWALMFGRSALESVDNVPLDQSLPTMLEPIVDDFQAHRDIRRVIEIIARSDAFRVDSRADFDVSGEHERHYAVFPLTRLRGEQVAGAITQAARIKSIDRNSSFIEQLIKFGSINDFLKRYGDLGENEFTKEGITIPQRLAMLNGKMLRESVQTNPVLNASAHINMFAKDDATAIETAFLCLLNRRPLPDELDYFRTQLEQADDRGEAMEDVFWTLANTTEFAWNH